MDVEYVDVKSDPAGLKKMLVYSDGLRKVPVIVEGENVTIGHDGKT